MNPNTVDLRRRSLLAGTAAAPLLGLGLASCGLDGAATAPARWGSQT
ncbi:hypothetical protein [Brachybacterium muris]|nr:hypothetical protein [Brachybacterium muris]